MGSVAAVYIWVPGGSGLWHVQVRGARVGGITPWRSQGGRGVGCTLISPGFVDSDIAASTTAAGLHAHVDDPVPAWLRMKTDVAAKIMVDGILRGRREVIVTFHEQAHGVLRAPFPAA